MNGSVSQAPSSLRRAEEDHRVDAHHLERVDLVGDPHRAELGDDPGADLGGHHVAEGVGDHLAQVAPGGERAGERRRPVGAAQVGALDPAGEAEEEGQPPDHDGGAQDQDPGLAQRLAEEVHHPARVDVAEDATAEAGDVAERAEPLPRNCEPAGHLLDDARSRDASPAASA